MEAGAFLVMVLERVTNKGSTGVETGYQISLNLNSELYRFNCSDNSWTWLGSWRWNIARERRAMIFSLQSCSFIKAMLASISGIISLAGQIGW